MRHGRFHLLELTKIKKAISERGWGPCNRNPLLYKEIQNTMTKEDIVAFELMKQNFIPPNDSFQEVPLQSVIASQQIILTQQSSVN